MKLTAMMIYCMDAYCNGDLLQRRHIETKTSSMEASMIRCANAED
jgi:hypothetical protein